MVETEQKNGGYGGHGWIIITETALFYISEHRPTLHRLWTACLHDLETSERQFTITFLFFFCCNI